jgi:hypothetical protein
MNRWLLSMAIPMIVAFTAPLALAEPGWKDYVNARFGFRFSHPSALLADSEPPNGAGRTFYTKDKEFLIAAWGHFMVDDDTMDKRWAEEMTNLGSFATYKRKEKNWYVISGAKAGIEFYHTVHFHHGNAVSLQIEYPHAQNQQYDPWVEKIAKSFVPFLHGDFDRIVQ